ncbi:hypothetical protein MVLG_01975 [Microbotryum lychnidis-dioicae p1A1 Lamole]|uniref:Fungal-type protein kinase domain-containing protein n=1 Tax=Microbotryum lychnidis-dioicae (strain p1A1 Lamole / MvSl-1064) TaxID=683840 RepID=U5H3R5_USTV1|nr:hypothetical protein MVLG_01975 [Microbotryum lychnidis-dioicae p1A1 Lamole]|eukprot:KDE07882.1 hypothetical protein MVLG_01975 [Microbotryum lychnidis-dioicae p1A1 Lamole]
MVNKQRARLSPKAPLNTSLASKRQTRSATHALLKLKLEHCEVESPPPVEYLPLSAAAHPLNAFPCNEEHTVEQKPLATLPVKPTAWTPPSPAPSDSCSDSSDGSQRSDPLSSPSGGEPTRTRAHSLTVKRLMSSDLDMNVDRFFIEDEIVPRVVICSASDLVRSALGFDGTQFKRQAQDALARPGRSEVQVLFDKDCRRSQDQRVADWVLPLAEFASGGPHRQSNLKLAYAERQARLTYREGVYHQDHVERHYFLTCCDEPGSKNGRAGTHSMLVPLAFGAPQPPGFTVPPLINVVLDLARDALKQPARMYAPGLAILDNEAHLVVLDHEGCRIAIIPDCWGEGFGELASVLSVLLGLDVYSAGASPFFRYTLHLKTGITPVAFRTLYLRPSELEADAPLFGRTVEFVAEEPIELVECRVAGRSSIFGRCTVIFELTRPSLAQGSSSTSGLSPSFVLKIQHVNQKSKGCEADVLDKLVQCCASHGGPSSLLIERHIPLPEKVTSLGLHRSQMDDSALPVLMDPNYPKRSLEESSRRTLEVLIVRNPTPLPMRVDTGRGPQYKLSQACEVFDQLLTLLPALWDLGIHHRDLSLGNILHYQGHLVLVDWDSAIVAEPGARVPIGADDAGSLRVTVDTASHQALAYLVKYLNAWKMPSLPSHALHHDFESSIYWFLYVLYWYIGPSVSAESWKELQIRPLAPSEANVGSFCLDLTRLELWRGGVIPNHGKSSSRIWQMWILSSTIWSTS